MRESVLVSVLLLGQLGSVLLGTLWEHAEDPPPPKDGEAEIFIHRFPSLTG